MDGGLYDNLPTDFFDLDENLQPIENTKNIKHCNSESNDRSQMVFNELSKLPNFNDNQAAPVQTEPPQESVNIAFR